MKYKAKPLVRGKRVDYFNHRYGIVNGRTKPGLKIVSGLASVVIVFGGLGVGATKYMDYADNKKKAAHLQSQKVTPTPEQKDGQSDNLKSAITKAREDEGLAKQIKAKLKNVPGGQKWSVYVRDLNSDRMASINADDVRDANGFGNLMMTLPLQQKTPAERWNARATGQQTVQQCVEQAIRQNNEDCAKALAKFTDMKAADGILSGQGFKKTVLNDKEKKTTAREMGEFLYRIQNGQLLTDKARRTVFDGLYGQQFREGLPGGCDAQSCLVANVTSEGKGVRHDAAIVTSGSSKYVVVVMTNEASWSQMADVSKEIFQLFRP